MRLSLRSFLAFLLCTLILAGCNEAAPRARPVNVVATVTPLADWARKVGGERVRVQAIVPPGVDPRAYQPPASQRKAIQTADVVIFNGLGLEPWIDEILDGAGNARTVVLDVSQFTGPLTERVPAGGPGVGQRRKLPGPAPLVPAPVYSPYLWLDPRSAITQVSLIAQMLTRADEEGLDVYRQNAARYTGELENLDSRIQREVDAWKWPSVLATDRFLYPFARRYGLPLYVLDDPANRARVPKEQPLLVDHFAPSAEQARAMGLRRPVAVLNPLAGQTYFELMRTNVHTMTTVMVRP